MIRAIVLAFLLSFPSLVQSQAQIVANQPLVVPFAVDYDQYDGYCGYFPSGGASPDENNELRLWFGDRFDSSAENPIASATMMIDGSLRHLIPDTSFFDRREGSLIAYRTDDLDYTVFVATRSDQEAPDTEYQEYSRYNATIYVQSSATGGLTIIEAEGGCGV